MVVDTYNRGCFSSPQHVEVLHTGLRGERGVREDAEEVEGPSLSAGREQEHPTGGGTDSLQ